MRFRTLHDYVHAYLKLYTFNAAPVPMRICLQMGLQMQFGTISQ